MARQIKCPLCDHTMSALRDLCPECMTDLRAAKQKVGLPVSHPNVEYDELLAKSLGRPLTSPVSKLVDNVLEGIASIFSSVSSPISRSAVRLPLPDTPQRNKAAAENVPTTQPDASDEAQSAADSEYLTEPSFVQASQRESDKNATLPLLSSVEDDGALHTVTYPPPSSLTATPAQVDSLQHLPEAHAATVIDLFEACSRDWLTVAPTRSLEISLSSFQAAPKTEEVELLFELSDESFLNPSIEDRYSDEVQRTDTATVTSDFLRQELERAERALNADSLSLKEMQRLEAAKSRRDLSESRKAAAAWLPVVWRQRFAAWSIDVAVCFFVTAAASAFAVEQFHPQWWEMVWEGAASSIHLLSLLCVGVPIFLGVYLAYPLCAVALTGTTFGRERLGIDWRTSRGSRASRVQIVVRDLSVPALTIIGGWLAVVFRHAHPSSRLTDTYAARIRATEDETERALPLSL